MTMDYSLVSIDDEKSEDSKLGSQCLQLKYHESLRTAELIMRDEESRRLRLKIHLLEDENDQLCEQLAGQDDNIASLEEERAALETELEQRERQIQKQEIELRVQVRELKNVKAELTSMSGLSVDSTKLLTEKLSLSRELATLKPEIDHLRAQASHQQTILAEKLALQRQLSTLEVELEAAKNIQRRPTSKDNTSDRENELSNKIDELREEVAREKREKEKALKQVEKGSSEWEASKAVLESKLEAARSKLRETKSQVKSLQADLIKAQAASMKAPASTRDETTPLANPRKRSAVEISRDASIGTPDGAAFHGRRGNGRRGPSEHSILGEKSTFSITPYLNKTISNIADSPQGAQSKEHPRDNQDDAALESNHENPSSPSSKRSRPATSEQPGKQAAEAPRTNVKTKVLKPNILTESKAGNANATGGTKRKRKIEFLEKVHEEEEELGDENKEPESSTSVLAISDPKKSSTVVEKASAVVNEPKKKKRKLGSGKTIFDEEDAESTKRPGKITLGPPRSLGKAGGMKARSLGLASDQFGGFSPLKKDKRGTQASFLA